LFDQAALFMSCDSKQGRLSSSLLLDVIEQIKFFAHLLFAHFNSPAEPGGTATAERHL